MSSETMETPVWLLAAAALALIAGVRRPGWSAAPARHTWAVLLPTTSLASAVVLGLATDAVVRQAARIWAGQYLLPASAPVGVWLTGPTFPRDLLASLSLAAVLLADGLRPGALTLGATLAIATRAGGRCARWITNALPVLPVLWGWADVLAATAGASGQRWYAAAASWGLLLPEPLLPEPEPRLPAVGWWLATTLVALPAARQAPGRWATLWLSVPLAAGLLAYASRPTALALSVPAFFAASAAATAQGLVHRGRRDWPAVLGVLERPALLGIVALALSLRWWGFDEILSNDAYGYQQAALEFHGRIAASGTNPIALAYGGMHGAGREPLFPVIVRLAFDFLGESTLHLRYVSIFGSLGAVVVAYLFGRAVLGPVAGLGAALLLAVEPWHALAAHQGLREEAALVFVYGLAAVVAARPAGPTCGLPRLVVAGLLAAAAVLTRWDSGAVVAYLLAALTVSLRSAWRRSVVAWGVAGALVAPLLVGFGLKFGDPLAPVGTMMGGDIQDLIFPLLRLEYSFVDVARYVAVGTARIYTETVFSGSTQWLRPIFGDFALLVVLGLYVAGALHLLVRGPRLPSVLSVLGTFLPPYAFNAGHGLYSARYAYLVAPAAFAVLSWTAARAALWLVSQAQSLPAARTSRWRRARH